jgi:glycosyltransferase involved in cell wall biosynthesis
MENEAFAGPRTPTVSIVVPAFNEVETVGRCLAAAVNQTVAPVEVIVVDNLSTDGTADVVRAFAAAHPRVPVRLLHCPVQGLIPTRNLGLDAATGEVLGRIDADTLLDPTWVERVGAALSDPGVAAVTGPVGYHDLPWNRFGRVVDDRVRRWLLDLGPDYPFVFGSNMALRSSAWRTIRDESCRDAADQFHEDIDLAVHLHENGLRVRYDSTAAAAISARRMDDRPAAFHDYTGRYTRTYAAHGIARWYLRLPALLLRSVYWPVHLARTLRVPAQELAA